MSIEITEPRREILEYIKENEQPETSEIKKNTDSYEGRSNTYNNSLNKMEEEGYVISTKKGNRKTWELNVDGQDLLSSGQKVEYEDEINYEEILELLREYLRIDEESYNTELKEALGSEENFVKIDYTELEKFRPELADHLLENQKEFFDAFDQVISDIEISKGLECRIKNLPKTETYSPSKIFSEHYGRFLATEGIIVSNGASYSKTVFATFECTQCGGTYGKEQEENKLKSPYKCDCGSKKFELVEEVEKDRKEILIQERMDKNNPRKVRVLLRGEIAKEDRLENESLGSLIRFNGIVKKEQIEKKSLKYSSYIEANSYKKKNKNEVGEITDEKREKMKELSNHPEIIDKLTDSVGFGSIAGLDRTKKAYLLYRAGKFEEDNIHLLIIGEPGVGKSKFISNASERLQRGKYTDLRETTQKGLTVALEENKIEGGYEAVAGDLVRAHEGFFHGDEAGKFPGNITVFNTPMSKRVINRSAAGKSFQLPADTSVCLLMNPVSEKGKKWDGRPSLEDLPNDITKNQDTLSRFDLKVAIPPENLNSYEDYREERKKNEYILRDKEKNTELSEEELRLYLALAEEIKPKIPEAEEDYLNNLFIYLRQKDLIQTHREKNSIKNVVKALASLRLKGEVDRKDIKEGLEFWAECESTLNSDFRSLEYEDAQIEAYTSLEKIAEVFDEADTKKLHKEKLKERLDLGGSPTKQGEVFSDLMKRALEKGIIEEKGDGEVRFHAESGFVEDVDINEIVE